ncbi:MAG: FMN-binding protein [Gammaproteobacteria bacterium]|nr:FMN-binding protein [Gammaproteobacteria bacterium]
MQRIIPGLIIGLWLMFSCSSSFAKGTYQTPADFVQASFESQPPQAQVLWLDDDLRLQLEDILAHKYPGRRIRYWIKDQRSVWVLDEIGKKKPITIGIVIDKDKISQIKVLVFRETRGWEIKYPFFTQQFIDGRLNANNELDRTIDGISGATLSVRALTKLARIALLLNKKINHDS